MDRIALGVTLRLAFLTTLALLAIGLPLGYWLGTTRWRGRAVVEVLVALPLVIPPTVMGFFFLVATGPSSLIGRAWRDFVGAGPPFTFWGILLGSVVVNLPFAVRPFTASFAAVDRRLIEVSWCLGASRLETFFRTTLPLCWQGILAGVALTFAHALGEFGVVLMMGGNIPGVTRTLSIVIYDDVQAMDYQSAARTAALLVIIAFTVLVITHLAGWRRRPG